MGGLRDGREQKASGVFRCAGDDAGAERQLEDEYVLAGGAANYPYITVVILLFAVCYLKELPDGGKETMYAAGKGVKAGETTADGKDRITGKGLPGITFWIIPLGLFAGWSNENMGPAVWILSLVVISCVVREKRKVPVWMMLGNLFCLLGSVMVIVAPGNFVRSAQASDREYGLLWRLFLRGYAESRAALDYLFRHSWCWELWCLWGSVR